MKTLLYTSLLSCLCCCQPSSLNKITTSDAAMSPKDTLTPIWNDRLQVIGDFDGDNALDTLREHYLDGNTKKETNKYSTKISYDSMVRLAVNKNSYSFVTSNNEKIDTLRIASGGQVFGLSYLKNEGDLNNDGRDEISYVIDWADWSSVNTCHISTFDDEKWIELYSFPIRDWQISEPTHEFTGFMKPVNNDETEIYFINKEGLEDTVRIKLTEITHKKSHK